MTQLSKIEWTDYTWNPITGCLKRCDYCYARKMAENPFYHKAFPYKFVPHFYPERFAEVDKIPVGSKVFVCSMGELFSDNPDWTDDVMCTIKNNPQLTFQVLTKQPQRLTIYSPFPKNCWVGISTPDWLKFSNSLGYLAGVEASVRFLSFEPLQERISFDMMQKLIFPRVVNWVIVGQETPVKESTRPNPDWIREIITACNAANIPIFIKDNIINDHVLDLRLTEMRQEYPELL